MNEKTLEIIKTNEEIIKRVEEVGNSLKSINERLKEGKVSKKVDENLVSAFWHSGITISDFLKKLEKLPQEIKDTYKIGASEEYYGESLSQGYHLNEEHKLLVIEPHI